MFDRDRPTWQLPEGVSRGGWDYSGNRSIAEDYDSYFKEHPLLDFDIRWITEMLGSNLPQKSTVIDLGCGTGRALVHMHRLGIRGVGVDLSQPMLEVTQQKAEEQGCPLGLVRMNLANLDGLNDQSFDAAVCLFSTLGMVQFAKARQHVLDHVSRILKPGGLFLLHVHNVWASLYDPAGPWWLLRSYVRSLRSSQWEFGDRVYPYRGLPNMYLHSFRLPFLRQQLAKARLPLSDIRYLNQTASDYLPQKSLFPAMRAGGFFLTSRKAD